MANIVLSWTVDRDTITVSAAGTDWSGIPDVNRTYLFRLYDPAGALDQEWYATENQPGPYTFQDRADGTWRVDVWIGADGQEERGPATEYMPVFGAYGDAAWHPVHTAALIAPDATVTPLYFGEGDGAQLTMSQERSPFLRVQMTARAEDLPAIDTRDDWALTMDLGYSDPGGVAHTTHFEGNIVSAARTYEPAVGAAVTLIADSFESLVDTHIREPIAGSWLSTGATLQAVADNLDADRPNLATWTFSPDAPVEVGVTLEPGGSLLDMFRALARESGVGSADVTQWLHGNPADRSALTASTVPVWFTTEWDNYSPQASPVALVIPGGPDSSVLLAIDTESELTRWHDITVTSGGSYWELSARPGTPRHRVLDTSGAVAWFDSYLETAKRASVRGFYYVATARAHYAIRAGDVVIITGTGLADVDDRRMVVATVTFDTGLNTMRLELAPLARTEPPF